MKPGRCVTRGGEEVGPYSLNEVRQWVASGQLQPQDMVWRKGTSATPEQAHPELECLMAGQSDDNKQADERIMGDSAAWALTSTGDWRSLVCWGVFFLTAFKLFPRLMWSIVGIIFLLTFGYWMLREKPVPPPDPMVYTGKRLPIRYGVRQAQLSRNGWVMMLSGVPDGEVVRPLWCRVNGRGWTEIMKWDPKRGCNIGWLELGRPLALKDQIEIWAPGYAPAPVRLDLDSLNKATLRK